MTRSILILMTCLFGASLRADEVSSLQNQQAASAGMWQQYLMKEVFKTEDPQSKAMMMMMMMQAMQQQQSSSKASKKNKENEDKKEEKTAAEKMPTPGPLPSMSPPPAAPQENLKLVEEETKKDEAERQKKAEEEKNNPNPLDSILQPIALPKITIGLKQATPTPAPEEKEGPNLGAKTALSGITPPKGESLNFASANNTNGTGLSNNVGNPSLIGVSKNANPAQEVVGSERAVASVPEDSARGNVRKTAESAGDNDGGGDSSESKGEGRGNDDFFASLMAKMNGEDAMMAAESSGLGAEGDAAAGEPAPLSIFEFASLRYRRAAKEEGRLREGESPKAKAAMR
jgi:hypothetical protein